MAYTYNIPQATDQISVSQTQILANFTALGAIGGTPGVVGSDGLNVVPGAGFNYVYLPTNGALAGAPPITFPAANDAIYSATAPAGLGGLNEIYLNKQKAGPLPQQVPMTASIFATVASPGLLTQGWSYLPSGFIVQWGNTKYDGAAQAIPDNGQITVPFKLTFPNQCLEINVSILSSAATGGITTVPSIWVRDGFITTSNFILVGKGGNSAGQCYVLWWAIGY